MDIDFVVLWVDGSDPKWQAERSKYQSRGPRDSSSENRYRDWGFFRYWFRAVEEYAPWVRKIHFVTWGHIPDFLDTNNPKLHIVRHEEFIPKQYLPTFSSHTIELNIHRIEGLAEHFVYFNDDTFLLRPHKKSDFFRNGLPCVCANEHVFDMRCRPDIWFHAAINDICTVNAHYDKKTTLRLNWRKFISRKYRAKTVLQNVLCGILYPKYFLGFRIIHCPSVYLKSSFARAWEAEPELLELTCSHKFRDNSDLNQWFILWSQIASGQFAPKEMDNQSIQITDQSVDIICKCIERREHDMLCVHDSDDVDYEVINSRIIDAFERILPNKSSYEVNAP